MIVQCKTHIFIQRPTAEQCPYILGPVSVHLLKQYPSSVWLIDLIDFCTKVGCERGLFKVTHHMYAKMGTQRPCLHILYIFSEWEATNHIYTKRRTILRPEYCYYAIMAIFISIGGEKGLPRTAVCSVCWGNDTFDWMPSQWWDQIEWLVNNWLRTQSKAVRFRIII